MWWIISDSPRSGPLVIVSHGTLVWSSTCKIEVVGGGVGGGWRWRRGWETNIRCKTTGDGQFIQGVKDGAFRITVILTGITGYHCSRF